MGYKINHFGVKTKGRAIGVAVCQVVSKPVLLLQKKEGNFCGIMSSSSSTEKLQFRCEDTDLEVEGSERTQSWLVPKALTAPQGLSVPGLPSPASHPVDLT